MSDQNRPEEGSLWQHRNGEFYWVMFIANESGNTLYPEAVVFRSDYDDKIWTLSLSDWHRFMTLCEFGE